MVKSLLGGKASSEDVFFSNEDDLMNAIGVKTNSKAAKVEEKVPVEEKKVESKLPMNAKEKLAK
jgi:hypothetical protein